MKGFKDSVKVSTPTSHPIDALSHTINTSFDFFQFRPVFCEEMYPTDHFKVDVRDYFRAEPMAGACYANMYKKYSAFFVPYRILWNKFEDFLTGGSNGRLEFAMPHVKYSDFAKIATNMYAKILAFPTESPTPDQVSDKKHYSAVYRAMLNMWSDLGVPIDILFANDSYSEYDDTAMKSIDVPLLRFSAVRRIWYDWYRDQNLIGDDVERSYNPIDYTGYAAGYVSPHLDADFYNTFSAATAKDLLSPLPVAVEKDYFTTMMIEPQRGGAAFVPVQLPSGDLNGSFNDELAAGLVNSGDAFATGLVKKNADGESGVSYVLPDSSVPVSGFSGDSLATNILGMFDYNSLRIAKGVQKFLEKNNIAGGSDLQQLLAHWGTAPNPAVFNRSTYIGSFVDNIALSELTAPIDNSEMSAGQVTTKMNSQANGTFEYTANEHGFFVIVMIARPENTYIGGFRREVLHGCLGNGRFDFFTPELEKTGMQAAYNWEKTSRVFYPANSGEDYTVDGVCGYVPRYAECKRQFNRFTAQMATDFEKHLRITRDFTPVSQLSDNDLFINADFTMVYGYPVTLPYDGFFKVENPLLDHFKGWIHFNVSGSSSRHEYSAPLIEDSKGDDITLPYAGVRM